MKAWTKEDCGCYADCASGLDHANVVLASLIETTLQESDYSTELKNDLLSDDSEIAWFAAEDAIDVLNENVEDGIYFCFRDGDLLLLEENEDN